MFTLSMSVATLSAALDLEAKLGSKTLSNANRRRLTEARQITEVARAEAKLYLGKHLTVLGGSDFYPQTNQVPANPPLISSGYQPKVADYQIGYQYNAGLDVYRYVEAVQGDVLPADIKGILEALIGLQWEDCRVGAEPCPNPSGPSSWGYRPHGEFPDPLPEMLLAQYVKRSA